MPTDLDQEELPTGNMIRAARGLVGIEQTELAKIIGVTSKTISLIERDISHRPDERRTRIVRQIRNYFTQEERVIFLYRQGELGDGVRLSAGKVASDQT